MGTKELLRAIELENEATINTATLQHWDRALSAEDLKIWYQYKTRS